MTPFRRLQAAQAISLFGDLLAVFAVQSAIVFRMHGSARQASGVFVASLIPSILLGPIAGVWADRWPPRRVLLVSDIARAGLILLLLAAHNLQQIYAVSFLMSLLACFFQPSFSISLSLELNQPAPSGQDRMRRIAKLQQSTQAVRLMGPMAAAGLAAKFGEGVCYGLDSLSFLLSAALLAGLRMSKPEPQAPSVAHPFINCGRELAEGVRFLFRQRDVSGVLRALVASTLAGGFYGALAPIYVRDLLHAPASTFALAGTLASAGTLAGSVLTGRFSALKPGALLPGGMATAALAILLMSAFPSHAGLWAGSMAMGAGGAMVAIAASTVTYSATPIALRGRVNSAITALNGMAQAMAFLLAGACSHWIGIRGVYFAASCVLAAVAMAHAPLTLSAFRSMIKAPIQKTKAGEMLWPKKSKI